MKKVLHFLGYLVLLAIVVYLLGPQPPKAILSKDLPTVSTSLGSFDKYIARMDEGLKIKPDNEARVVWNNDSLRERTEYCLLYLHGFSASWYEGYPANTEFAEHFGCNAYFARMASHGIDTDDALIDMTPDRLWESAKEALMIARSLGRKVIVMGTSTGGTLALKLAADFPEYVDALILYSPNIRINNSTAFLLSKPWGLQIGRAAMDGKYRTVNEDFDSKDCQYWNCKYRIEAIVFLQQLVDETMNKTTFEKVTAPVFLGYYYRDKEHQDQTVRVDAMLKMFGQLGTDAAEKVKVAFPEAGDHVIGCELTSDSYRQVAAETIKFGEEILGLKAAN